MNIRHTHSPTGTELERRILIILHGLLILAIALQWISAEVMAEPWSDEGSSWGRLLFSVHYWSGITTVSAFLGMLFLLRRRHRPLRPHFFPWLHRGGRQQALHELRSLRAALRQKTLPAPAQTQVIAGSVQGLGLLALAGMALTGAAMAIIGPETHIAHDIAEIHELFFAPLKAYLLVHGAAGLLHMRAAHRLFVKH